MRRLLSLSFALSLTLFLAACDSAEERAEAYYQSALALVEQGDTDRAIVELRNIFPLVPNHLEARHELARLLLQDKERPRQAYRQYLRIVEQYPDDLLARIELTKMAFFSANWDEATRHATKAREIDLDDPRVQIIDVALNYRTAVEQEDDAARSAAVQTAATLIDPANPDRMLRELILDDHLRNQSLSAALTLLDELSAEFPTTPRYWRQRLQVLLAMGDEDAVEAQLVDLVERFPEDVDQQQMLIRYFLSRGELDKTEDYLRGRVAAATEDDTPARIDLVRFLIELRGPEQARAEIADAITNSETPTTFIMLGAAIDFSTGNTEGAISALESAIETAEPSDETNEMKVSLANMLLVTGNEVGARALVETVLTDDATQVGALKMNAGWLIEADDTDGAIAALRTALDAAPEDAAALTLMANAYSRTGSLDLARDFLALAAEASGNAPAETIRYAEVLISEERYLPAEDVLLPALRLAPGNLDLLRTTAQLYFAMDDHGRTQQVIDTLRRINSPGSNQLAVQLEATLLSQSGGTDEAIAYLEGLANSSDADTASRILLLRARLSTGDTDGALALAQQIAADQPDSPAAKLVLGTTLSASGDLDGALAIYAALADEFPNETSLRVEMSALQVRNGDQEGARRTIAVALETSPDDMGLMWASASFLELDGDIDAAIDVYETMYAFDSGNLVVANNLASLMATYRDDEASLTRAWTIARRFRDSNQPAVQDTYGWISHRRGDSNEALPYLQSAAAGLPGDAIVQYHLAEVLFALDQKEQALEQYRIALDRAGIGDTRPQIILAQQRITEIEAASAASE